MRGELYLQSVLLILIVPVLLLGILQLSLRLESTLNQFDLQSRQLEQRATMATRSLADPLYNPSGAIQENVSDTVIRLVWVDPKGDIIVFRKIP